MEEHRKPLGEIDESEREQICQDIISETQREMEKTFIRDIIAIINCRRDELHRNAGRSTKDMLMYKKFIKEHGHKDESSIGAD
jgi:hypothetical protein